MENFALIAVFVALGILFRRLKAFPPETVQVLNMFALYVSLPAVILLKVPQIAAELGLYLAIVARGLVIAARAPTLFGRLMAATLSLNLFTYVFVNMGMVSGILPVVGVPLPLMSYGGTALITLLSKP